MERKTLMDCAKNSVCFVKSLDTKNIGVSRRLSELGFCPNVRVRVVCFSSLKKTILVEILGYTLSLRASVANLIFVGE